MKKLLLMIVMLCGFIAPVFGSEKNKEIISFNANVGTLGYNPLRYCDKKHIDFLKNIYEIKCDYNEPYLMLYHHAWEIQDQPEIQKELIQQITLVPFKYFLNGDLIKRDNNTFKQLGAILFSFSKIIESQEKQFQVKLASDFGEKNPQDLLDEFRKNPRCMLGHIFDEKNKLLSYVDTTELEKKLCEADIMRKVGKDHGYGSEYQKYEHWLNSCFGDEVKAEQQTLFYSGLRKIVGGLSIAAVILMYILYQKFYAPSLA